MMTSAIIGVYEDCALLKVVRVPRLLVLGVLSMETAPQIANA